jgi:hypothetical protein
MSAIGIRMVDKHQAITEQLSNLEEDIAFLGYAYDQASGPDRRAEVQNDIEELMQQILDIEYKQLEAISRRADHYEFLVKNGASVCNEEEL